MQLRRQEHRSSVNKELKKKNKFAAEKESQELQKKIKQLSSDRELLSNQKKSLVKNIEQLTEDKNNRVHCGTLFIYLQTCLWAWYWALKFPRRAEIIKVGLMCSRIWIILSLAMSYSKKALLFSNNSWAL